MDQSQSSDYSSDSSSSVERRNLHFKAQDFDPLDEDSTIESIYTVENSWTGAHHCDKPFGLVSRGPYNEYFEKTRKSRQESDSDEQRDEESGESSEGFFAWNRSDDGMSGERYTCCGNLKEDLPIKPKPSQESSKALVSSELTEVTNVLEDHLDDSETSDQSLLSSSSSKALSSCDDNETEYSFESAMSSNKVSNASSKVSADSPEEQKGENKADEDSDHYILSDSEPSVVSIYSDEESLSDKELQIIRKSEIEGELKQKRQMEIKANEEKKLSESKDEPIPRKDERADGLTARTYNLRSFSA